MRANKRRDSRPEIELRRELHRRGMRFRVDHLVAAPGIRRVRVDVVFPRQRLAIFVDGCFWHGCPDHGTTPKTNHEYWSAKILSNQARDARQTAGLETGDWIVLRIWEHEAMTLAADRVALNLREASSRAMGSI